MDLTKIIAWLTEHEADAGMLDFLKGLVVQTPESIAAYLKTEEGKKAALKTVQSDIDRRVTEGIESFKTNNLDKLVEEAYNKKHPPEDERDARIRALEERDRQREAELTREKRRTAALQRLGEEQLPVELVDRLIGDTDEDTSTHIETYKKVFTETVNLAVEARMKANKPPKPGDDDPTKSEVNPWKKKTWNMTKQGEIFKADPEKAARLKAEAEKQDT
jgi:hypothetical protein